MIEVDEVEALSVKWDGRIDLTSVSKLKIDGTGKVKVVVTSIAVSPIITTILDTTTLVSTTIASVIQVGPGFTIAAAFYDISIEYYPPATDAKLSLKYEGSGGRTLIIPAAYLSSKQTVSGFSGSLSPLVVSVGAITGGELLIPAPVVLETQTSFYVKFNDVYLNSVSKDGCDHIELSLLDVNSVVVDNAFGASSTTETIQCSSLTSSVDGYVGSVAIYTQADYFKLRAVVESISATLATITSETMTILTPYSST
jgi:hypothetical protein